MKNDKVDLMCELCGGPTSVTLKLGDLLEKMPDLKPMEGNVYLHGMCQKCGMELHEGATFFIDSKHRVMKLTVEATKEKLKPEFWGKVLKIPVSAMDELVQSWASANHEPPRSTPPAAT